MKTKLFLTTLLTLWILAAFSQRPYVETNEEFTELATANLNDLLKDEKFLKDMAKEDIHGSYTYAITVGDNGKISHMRSLERSAEASIHGQNTLNDLVKKHKFDFKIPKGNFYNFQYTFILP